MKISVIIPTYNEEKVILDCLRSLDDQFYKDFEVIVVDDGSIDKTLEIISNFKTKRYELTVLKQLHRGPAMARNLGAKHAKGKILVFVDADMTFAKTFLGELSGPIIEGRTMGTFSKLEYVANNENIWSQCWGFNEGWVYEMRHPLNYPDHQKVFRAILKSEFDRVDGFSKGGYTDDYTLSEKLGYEADAVKGVFYHKNPDTLSEIFRQAKWVGKRKYKLGLIGIIVALIRSSFPVSILVGLYKAVDSMRPYLVYVKNDMHDPPYTFDDHSKELIKRFNIAAAFIVFKIVYDFGIFVGILEMIFTGKTSK